MSLFPPLTDPKLNESVGSISSYDITRTIRMSREELRIQRLHDMALIFESAFDALEVKS